MAIVFLANTPVRAEETAAHGLDAIFDLLQLYDAALY